MVVTIYGVCAVTFMMAMYALEHRHRRFILAFALGCILSSAYGFLSGAWPFGVVELIWSGIALRRYQTTDPITGGAVADAGGGPADADEHDWTGVNRPGR